MRILLLAAAIAALGATAPAAQTPAARPAAPPAVAPAEPLGPPRAFIGYTQPDIGAAACRAVNASQTSCSIPAMTAGRYLIEASGTSTANAAGAVQKLGIIVGSTSCGTADRRPTPASPWPAGVAKTIKLQCEVEILTDRPLVVLAVYADDKATRSATGPTLVVRRLPWDGVLSTRVSSRSQD
ncbi:MAG: hypothetical protein Q7J28_11870 [Caulobacter sp.]|nr:hypothetical protein [Caulobacter sp.]